MIRFFGRHRRGDLGLTSALWAPLAVLIAGWAVVLVFRQWGHPLVEPMPAFFLALVSWWILLIVAVWFFAGLSAAALRQRRLGGRRYLVVAASGLMLLAAIVGGGILAQADMARSVVRVQENLPITAVIRPLNGGTELLFEGFMEYGSGNALAKAAASLPNVKLIRLNSIGAKLHEARRVRDFIAAKGWDTHTSATCWSGCAIAYMGGVHRTMGEGAQMGFHSANVWLLGGDVDDVNASIAQEMIDRGVDATFARRAWSRAYRGMWFPAPEELVRVGVVHELAER